MNCRGEFGAGHTSESGAWCRVCGKNLAWEDTWHILVVSLLVVAVALLLLCLIAGLTS